MAVETVPYTIVKQTSVYEIRAYDKTVVVQTSQGSGENGAFMKLFRYISGANDANQKIAMTAPVAQQEIDGTSVMQFFLPSAMSANQAPKPNDPDIRVIVNENSHLAVLQFSGRSNDANFEKHAALLLQALQADGVKTIGTPIRATYNGPFTPPFLRKNETMVRVAIK